MSTSDDTAWCAVLIAGCTVIVVQSVKEYKNNAVRTKPTDESHNSANQSVTSSLRNIMCNSMKILHPHRVIIIVAHPHCFHHKTHFWIGLG